MAGVPGRGGPVPKRANQRHGHRSKAEKEAIAKVQVAAPAIDAPEPDESWHPLAQEWFRSLGQSGQHIWYEPSDWATARYVAEAMSRNLSAGQRFSAHLFASVMSAMTNLLTTEGERRRLRIELQRAGVQDEDEDHAVAMLDDWRKRLGTS